MYYRKWWEQFVEWKKLWKRGRYIYAQQHIFSSFKKNREKKYFRAEKLYNRRRRIERLLETNSFRSFYAALCRGALNEIFM